MSRFRIDGTPFAVPSRNVRSISREPPGFIRINDPDSPIELAYHAGLQGRTDARGAPLLFSINDGDYPRIVYRKTAEGALVVCRVAAAAPRGGCASAVEFEGATWTILFPDRRIGEADVFRQRAEALLRSFRI